VSHFRDFRAIAAPIEGVNVDTDQIIPARFLKFDRASGYGRFLFHDLRFEMEGRERPEFILNRDPFRAARILVADENFGCGSSREGAVYALGDYGIRVVIAPRFGDIFYNNCLRNGVLPALISVVDAAALRKILHAASDPSLTVDLPSQTIRYGDGEPIAFSLDAFWRDCLLEGVDEIGLALRQMPQIEAFEQALAARRPWTASACQRRLTGEPGLGTVE
jgi:3-isopropylmalate/(R)-2-methylmalate dehydratase small subunit